MLDMPCYCDDKIKSNEHINEIIDENNENDSLDDNIDALFNGVSDDDESDLDLGKDLWIYGNNTKTTYAY